MAVSARRRTNFFTVRRTIDCTGSRMRSVIYNPAVTTNPFVDGDEELDWDLLIRRIAAGRCTPFIGAGACHGTLPLGAQIASAWADRHGYPLRDSGDLARVAQFLAVKKDPQFPKELIVHE